MDLVLRETYDVQRVGGGCRLRSVFDSVSGGHARAKVIAFDPKSEIPEFICTDTAQRGTKNRVVNRDQSRVAWERELCCCGEACKA